MFFTPFTNMITIFLFHMHCWLLCFSQLCFAGDTLNVGQEITGNGTVLVSAAKKFELGFFSPDLNVTGGKGRYLGIWYYREEGSGLSPVVWVANRDNPVADDSIGVFRIADDGNLVVLDTSGIRYWSASNLTNSSSATNRSVKLMDSGNLVLLDEHVGMKLWESFEHPTDTFLPGMKMDKTLELTCWKSLSDPGRGNFTFKMDKKWENRFAILNQGQLYWQSEEQGDGVMNPESNPDDISNDVYNLLTNFKELKNKTVSSYDNTRLLLNSTGVIKVLYRVNFQSDIVWWYQPRTTCLTYNVCGNFSSCNDDNDKLCTCLPGFGRRSPLNDYTVGGDTSSLLCTRKSTSCGANTNTFLNLTMMKIGSPDIKVSAQDENECKFRCISMCSQTQCQACSYVPIPVQQRGLNLSPCWIWTQNLTTLKEEYLGGDDRKLFVRVAKSDIAPTPKTCDACGINIVPYPLSTGGSCGESLYFKFSCNYSTGQLSFFTSTNSKRYQITRVEPDSRKFFIEVTRDKRHCGDFKKAQNDNLDVSFPFNSTDDPCSDQVAISWQPPSEPPTCANSSDCNGWKHSTCKGNRCRCNANYYWHGDLLSCTEKEPTRKGNPKSTLSLILGIALPGVVILACICILAYVCRRKIALKLKQESESIQRQRGRFYDSERHVKDLIDKEGLEEKDNEGIEVPYFDFESILVATDYFSDANKLGRGGYGTVYKGKLQGGREIAVKRLSSVSSQGIQEFKNEVVLIAKLQHRNLVRLWGYCIKGDEKILIYEYMPNKSLDAFVFDPTKSALLDWQMRFDILLGIARGLLYLHQDSRLRVIHRDLKTSNILLDGEMQPKISDFGLARIFGGKETEANTQRVVGTYGYMSPEYALDGQFSTKSDIFSFGVVLLEIISGKKNTGFYQYKGTLSLLGYRTSCWI
ncbi:G-type lectin S-receptor-like serine/threonine-protein kinase At4g03230 isoform X2 [Lotus japonicus]|uniref:G-type lectin S-receptor-like serine/threonine-protein kinase At4g03230 isoform X2 n=1 Tax=Lotus japonicus TaxID=34305 RepID=UPI00258F5A14|nr:G-type lectin S-receptor-like serine/threonine-protein kinase At4g03230 isoform X2 [Lotus japonicus]